MLCNLSMFLWMCVWLRMLSTPCLIPCICILIRGNNFFLLINWYMFHWCCCALSSCSCSTDVVVLCPGIRVPMTFWFFVQVFVFHWRWCAWSRCSWSTDVVVLGPGVPVPVTLLCFVQVFLFHNHEPQTPDWTRRPSFRSPAWKSAFNWTMHYRWVPVYWNIILPLNFYWTTHYR